MLGHSLPVITSYRNRAFSFFRVWLWFESRLIYFRFRVCKTFWSFNKTSFPSIPNMGRINCIKGWLRFNFNHTLVDKPVVSEEVIDSFSHRASLDVSEKVLVGVQHRR